MLVLPDQPLLWSAVHCTDSTVRRVTRQHSNHPPMLEVTCPLVRLLISNCRRRHAVDRRFRACTTTMPCCVSLLPRTTQRAYWRLISPERNEFQRRSRHKLVAEHLARKSWQLRKILSTRSSIVWAGATRISLPQMHHTNERVHQGIRFLLFRF